MKDLVRTMLDGFAMALADSVPGVSGGTIAFILGFYEKFIGALEGLVFKKGAERKQALIYLVKLGAGWIIGMGLAVMLLAKLFDVHIYEISSLFLGLVVAAIPVIVIAERKTLEKRWWRGVGFVLIGVGMVVLVTWLGTLGEGSGVDARNLDFGTALLMLAGGIIGTSAMMLPGISGSTLLLILGVYVPLVSGVRDVLKLDFSSLPAVLLFAVGAVIGAVVVVKIVKAALDRYRRQVVFVILGLMMGSIYAIVMGPTTLSEPMAAVGPQTFNIWFFFVGVAIIGLTEVTKRILSRRSGHEASRRAQSQD